MEVSRIASTVFMRPIDQGQASPVAVHAPPTREVKRHLNFSIHYSINTLLCGREHIASYDDSQCDVEGHLSEKL